VLDGTRASRGSLGQDFAQPGSSCGAESDEAARTFSGKSRVLVLTSGSGHAGVVIDGPSDWPSGVASVGYSDQAAEPAGR